MFGLPFPSGFTRQYFNFFEERYKARPLAFIDKQNAEYGDKVILPPSALNTLTSLHIEYPMLFNVTSVVSKRLTHCGVLEFIAEEGYVYLPQWMMQNLLLAIDDVVIFKNVSLPKGSFVKLQPSTSDFLDISNPKAVLERSLRNYTCLTVGDLFIINYNNKVYEIEVKEAKPKNAISIVETDCQVDFEAPKDYKEPEIVKPKTDFKSDASQSKDGSVRDGSKNAPTAAAASSSAAVSSSSAGGGGAEAVEPAVPTFMAFAGSGRRLDGKASGPSAPMPVLIRGSLNTPLPEPSSTSAGAVKNGGANGSSNGNGKNGTLVGFNGMQPGGNRLLAKLEREKQEQQAGAGYRPPQPEGKAEEEKEVNKFKAFGGKSYSFR